MNYNLLDSLISYAGTLQENEYTTESWANFAAALSFAQNSKDQDYSSSVSAADALSEANDTLQAAIDGLVITDVEDRNDNNLKVFMLSQNYPNPFNPSTLIKYSIPQNSFISLKVFNLLGQEVVTLYEGLRQAGNYVASFDGSALASGVYVYQLKVNDFLETKKLILLK